MIDARKFLRDGINLIAVAARNWPGAPDKQDADQSNPAGFWFYGRVRDGSTTMDFASDSSWLWTVDAPEDWYKPDFGAAHWNQAAELGDSNINPWNSAEPSPKRPQTSITRDTFVPPSRITMRS
jgi:hypothetical protein